MKFSAGLVLAAIAVAGATAESTSTLTVEPKTLTHVDPDMIMGLGPAVPAENNPKVKKAMDELAGSHDDSSSGSYYTIDPHSLPTVDPKSIIGLGPAVIPGMPGYGKAWEEFTKQEGATTNHRQLESTNTLTVDTKALSTQSPSTIEGLGPMTPAGDNPKLKKAMDDLATKSGSTNTLDATKTAPPTLNSAVYGGLGPAVIPGMPGYGQNAQFNKLWKEYQKQEGASTSGSSASNCAQVCPDVFEPVCGSDGATYRNSCFLGIASCNNPDKHIAKASDGACTQTTEF
ncbi:hypothetical protein V7S43_003884 [Phytophthora oleae]|uniref:Kazal-like domain-containing protein n=1 Tax=Phytophthora oleae TaxID=2107226 RepID=A0ABD3FWK6_9STRA